MRDHHARCGHEGNGRAGHRQVQAQLVVGVVDRRAPGVRRDEKRGRVRCARIRNGGGPVIATPVVAVCVVTYLRPVGLERLLARLSELDWAGGSPHVIVVDNDAGESARTVVDAARSHSALPLDYVVEARRGITYARNAALERAGALAADWIVWFDDDEVPQRDWLACVFETQRATEADVVIGPSEPVLEPGGSAVVIAADAFHHERFETGQEYPFFHTRTSGVLVRAAVVPRDGFDDRLALTGGEDRLFFTQDPPCRWTVRVGRPGRGRGVRSGVASAAGMASAPMVSNRCHAQPHHVDHRGARLATPASARGRWCCDRRPRPGRACSPPSLEDARRC